MKYAREQSLPYGKPEPRHKLTRPNMDVVKRAFARCHRIIWKSEKMSPQAAFVEFAKLLFVKLWEDRKLRDRPELLEMIGKGESLPASQVRFSKRWIAEQEANDPNPVDGILFRQLVVFLEEEIEQRKRKRIFETNERLRLSSGTAKRVVEVLEDYYLFGIDEDLNGRMFEAFLAATMRGQALGQYFTPRSIVKLITRLARLHAGRDRIERVVDACCGTGGFLIEALTEMRRQIWDNPSLTKREREQLLEEVANQAISGFDAGRDRWSPHRAHQHVSPRRRRQPRLYDGRAAPPARTIGGRLVEIKNDIKELRKELSSGLEFDVAVTNPPFSMDYSSNVPEEREVLNTYDLATFGGKKKASLRSSVMFMERYSQLLGAGGRLLTVIDDSVLSGKNYADVRDFIRDRFIIRGIISLHGDAFQRAGARAKTSVLYLTKRSGESEEQPAAFVYESRYIGLDDVVPRTRPSVAETARTQAVKEIRRDRRCLRGLHGRQQGAVARAAGAPPRPPGREVAAPLVRERAGAGVEEGRRRVRGPGGSRRSDSRCTLPSTRTRPTRSSACATTGRRSAARRSWAARSVIAACSSPRWATSSSATSTP